MGVKAEEFKGQFEAETQELIVRISWCDDKRGKGFPMLENYYQAGALFDAAIDAKTREEIEVRAFNHLKWLWPKRLFGYKYGYSFQRGKQYRVLVREYRYQGSEHFRSYYLEKVIEKEVNDLALDPGFRLEGQFEPKVEKLLVLMKGAPLGWQVIGDYKNPSAVFIASVDSDVLNTEPGTLTWMEKRSGSPLKYNFKPMETYLVEVRKSKDGSGKYLLTGVLGKGQDSRLDKFRAEYLKPVEYQSPYGLFVLKRENSRLEGQVSYLDEHCPVYINVPEGETVPSQTQLIRLGQIYENTSKWCIELRAYAAKELLILANEWNEKELTEAEFVERIGLLEITVSQTGEVMTVFSDGEIFLGHFIVVSTDENGVPCAADIEG